MEEVKANILVTLPFTVRQVLKQPDYTLRDGEEWEAHRMHSGQ